MILVIWLIAIEYFCIKGMKSTVVAVGFVTNHAHVNWIRFAGTSFRFRFAYRAGVTEKGIVKKFIGFKFIKNLRCSAEPYRNSTNILAIVI